MPAKTKKSTPTRTDPEITREILRKMKANFDVPDDRITVKVDSGVVTINGTVSREESRIAAESCVKKVKGVRGIANRIELEPIHVEA